MLKSEFEDVYNFNRIKQISQRIERYFCFSL